MVHRFGFFLSLGTLCVLSSLATAVPHAHDHTIQKRILPTDTWHHPAHPAHNLFRRDTTGNTSLPAVGSPTWQASYPQTSPNISELPAAWVDALNAAVAAGKIPDIPPSTNNPQDIPTYPSGYNPSGPEVCSGTYKCQNPLDIWNATDGVFGCGFDDGPLPPSQDLYNFLKENNQRATHFMIGLNIFWYPQEFLQAFQNGDDIAVHTYTHPYLTTLTNLQLLAEFGWSMQIIHDSTGGRLPRYARAPYGDSDNRVRAIAAEIFGLTLIFWNHDTADWSLTVQGGTTPPEIETNMQTWLAGPKSPGVIILEHELSNASVQAFITAWPLIKQNGWNPISVAQMVAQNDNTYVYDNAVNDTSDVTETDNLLVGGLNENSTIAPPGVSTSATSTSSSSSGLSSGTTSSASSTGAAASGNLSGSPSSNNSSGALHLGAPIILSTAAIILAGLFSLSS